MSRNQPSKETPFSEIPIVLITINYNCSNMIKELIRSTSASGEQGVSFIVVNNSPQDPGIHEAARAASHSVPVTLLDSGGNLGFGGGCNLALDHVWRNRPQALAWLINPDAQLRPGAMPYVRQCLAEDPEIAMLGTRIRDLDGALWFSHGSFDPWLGTLRHRFDSDDCSPLPVRTWPTRWISGCSMIFHLAVFDHCPQFDPQYFLDYEDADISERYQRQGYRLRVTQAVLVDHQVSAITRRAPRAKYQHATFSKLYFLHRHGTPLALLLNLLYYALKPLGFCRSDHAMAKGRWWGLGDFLRWRWRRLLGRPVLTHPRTSFTTSS